jgi:hypothetical protein
LVQCWRSTCKVEFSGRLGIRVSTTSAFFLFRFRLLVTRMQSNDGDCFLDSASQKSLGEQHQRGQHGRPSRVLSIESEVCF